MNGLEKNKILERYLPIFLTVTFVVGTVWFWKTQIAKAGQQYCTPFTVAAAQMPSAQSNFTALIKPTDNRFKTTGNGGHVANANGYDIRPYTDATCSTAITTYELVSGTYDASAGTFEMWVKQASLDVGSVVYLGYGDSSLTTDGSSTTAWDSSYKTVYHLQENAANTTVNDSTGNYAGTAGTNTSNLASTGQIGGGFLGDLTNTVTNGDTTVVHYTDPFTMSAWFKTTDDTVNGQVILAYYDFATNGMDLKWSTNGNVYGSFYFNGAQIINYSSPTNSVLKNNWYYVTVTYDGSGNGTGAYAYVNGSGTQGGGSLPSGTSFGNNLRFLVQPGLGQLYGSLDEPRLATVARSADWVTSEYNNQVAPTTFWTMGTENTLGGGGGGDASSNAAANVKVRGGGTGSVPSIKIRGGGSNTSGNVKFR